MGRYQFMSNVISASTANYACSWLRQRADYVAPSQAEPMVINEETLPIEKMRKGKYGVDKLNAITYSMAGITAWPDERKSLGTSSHKYGKEFPVLIRGDRAQVKENICSQFALSQALAPRDVS